MDPAVQGVATLTVERAADRTLPRALRQVASVACLCVTDLVATAASCALAFVEQEVIRRWTPLGELTIFTVIECTGFLFTVVACGLLLRGMYSRREPFWETVRLTLTTTFTALLVAIAALYLLNVAARIPRSLAILAGCNLLLLAPVLRLITIRVLHWAGFWCRRVVVVGREQQARDVAGDLQRDYALGYEIVGIRPIPEVVETGLIGDSEYPPGIEEVVVVAPDVAPEAVHALVASAHRSVATVSVVPEFIDLPFAARRTQCLFDSRRMLLTSRNLLREPANVLLKRAFDLVVGLAVAVVALPLMALIAVAIRLDSPGAALFAQARMGRGGRRFSCLKFRTMHVDAEERLAGLLAGDPAKREEWERFHKLREDPRVTRVGRLLRRTSLDELPQIVNVVLGQMSLVGPRPLPDYHYRKLEEPYSSDYLDVTPGITGLWQVSGRSDADLHRMALLNSWYARNWSLWLDLTLLLRTIPAVLRARGAY